MKPIRVGILSTAHVHADGFASILKNTPNLEVLGFSEPDATRAEAFMHSTGLKHFRTHAALMAERPDAIILCSETALHLPLTRLVARGGAHILCEKPIATTLEDALEMQGICLSAGVKFMTAYPMRFDSSLVSLKKRLVQNDLGRVLAMIGVNHAENPMHRRAWFADKALAGGGAVMDHTVHLTDLYRWLLEQEVSSVQAEISNPFFPNLDIDSAGFATLTLGSGETRIPASIDCSWSRPVGIYPRWGHLKLEVMLEAGAFEIDAFAQKLQLYSRTAPRVASWLGWGSDATAKMVNAFLEAVRSDTPVPVTWQDGYAGLQVALACYDSSNQAREVLL
jgi:predicted dehydrogenase